MNLTRIGNLGWILHNADWSGDAELFIGDPDAFVHRATRPHPGLMPGPFVLLMARIIGQNNVIERVTDFLESMKTPALDMPTEWKDALLVPGKVVTNAQPPRSADPSVKEMLQQIANGLALQAKKYSVNNPADDNETLTHALEDVARCIREVVERGGVDPNRKAFQRDYLLALRSVHDLVMALDFDDVTALAERASASSVMAAVRRAFVDGEIYIDGFQCREPSDPITGLLKETFVVRYGNETRTVVVLP